LYETLSITYLLLSELECNDDALHHEFQI
jgi:hypothetical protein